MILRALKSGKPHEGETQEEKNVIIFFGVKTQAFWLLCEHGLLHLIFNLNLALSAIQFIFSCKISIVHSQS